ncbi:hypothetical protein HR060_05160 [Catenovulum sp. SM1970]|nr:hypothetical protein [Marinifaba aquimaris]NTS76251.1 hypothetical protein [Marinifaba aquimaris]
MRMCKTCHYYQAKPQQESEGFHCRLMQKDLPINALRLDCPEHFLVD